MTATSPPGPPGTTSLSFGPFLLDPAAGRLVRDGQVVPLRRKAWRVLLHLVQRPRVLVTADELFGAVWRGASVSPQTLTNVISEIRNALGDDPSQPRWVETVYGEGYRFIGEVDGTSSEPRQRAGDHPFVGRAAELVRLAAVHERVLAGRRATVLVTGDAGIGKTTLVDSFVAQLQRRAAQSADRLRVARGQCVEQHGQDEPYMPLLSALGDLARDVGGGAVLDALARYAPAWRVQLPWLLEADERTRLERSLLGTTPARMLREGAVLFERLAADAPLVVILEDLHWADAATVDLLSTITQRREPAGLLLVGTYRRGDASESAHPIAEVAAVLARRGHAETIDLAPFGVDDVQAYLRARTSDADLAASLAPRVVGQSAGNPLFVRSVTESILEQSAEHGEHRAEHDAGDGDGARIDQLRIELPDSLRESIHAELERLSPRTLALVEAASVAGVRFSVAVLAAALGRAEEQVERDLFATARSGRLLRAHRSVDWQNTEDAEEFAFVHAAYGRIVREQLPPRRRRALNALVAGAVEAVSADRLQQLAGRLAAHFDEAGSPLKSLDYLAMAAENAERRYAYREGGELLRTALARLPQAGGDEQLDQREAMLLLKLGSMTMLSHGYSDPEVAGIFRRAVEKCEAIGEPVGRFLAGCGQSINALTSARFEEAVGYVGELVRAASASMPQLAASAHLYAGYATSARGEFAAARDHLETALAHDGSTGVPLYYDVQRMVTAQLATLLTVTGELDRARRLERAALERGIADGRDAERAHATLFATDSAVMRRDRPAGRATAVSALAASEEGEFPTFAAMARFHAAWLDAEAPSAASVPAMERALGRRRSLGDRWHESMMLGLLAEAELAGGNVAGADARVAEALAFADRTGERHYEAELHRLAGECRLADRTAAGADAAAACFERSLAIARSQGARLWELRAAVSHATLLADGGRTSQATDLVRSVLTAFDASWPDADVRDARELLQRLGSD